MQFTGDAAKNGVNLRHPGITLRDAARIFDGPTKLKRLATSPQHVIPGHDPLVLQRYPAPELAGLAVRLDVDPQAMTPDEAFIRGLPKTELHMHLEGSMEPETMFEMARRNGVRLHWESPEALRAAYEFEGLSSFLDLYFEACAVLRTEHDFHDVTEAYLRRARADGVVHAEIFFGPQTFLDRDIPIASMMEGIIDALDAASGPDFSTGLLVSVHRHRSEADAFEVLRLIGPWADRVLGIGMGGPELGNPPAKFIDFFAACRAKGFRTTVHAGEEGPPAYIHEAIDLLQVSRIDHGVAAAQDPALVAELAGRGIPLTICPLSNLRLKVVESLAAHPLKALLAAGV